MEEECESLRKALSVEVDSRRELEGRKISIYFKYLCFEVFYSISVNVSLLV